MTGPDTQNIHPCAEYHIRGRTPPPPTYWLDLLEYGLALGQESNQRGKRQSCRKTQEEPRQPPSVGCAMEIWCKTAYLLLLTASSRESAATACHRGQAHVHLEHQESFVGSSATFNCTFTLPEGTEQFRVRWLLGRGSDEHCEGLEVSTRTSGSRQRAGGPAGPATEPALSILTLEDLRYNSSGWYFCQVIVEIPELCVFCSSEVQLIVKANAPITTFQTAAAPSTSSAPSAPSTSWLLLVTVPPVVAVLGGVAVALWISYVRKKRRQQESPIYENMHPASRNVASRCGQEINITNLLPLKHVGTLNPGNPRPTGAKRSPQL
ncbi:uncharacterized protein LOC108919916 isoform X2 [Arapaima gigas]